MHSKSNEAFVYSPNVFNSAVKFLNEIHKNEQYLIYYQQFFRNAISTDASSSSSPQWIHTRLSYENFAGFRPFTETEKFTHVLKTSFSIQISPHWHVYSRMRATNEPSGLSYFTGKSIVKKRAGLKTAEFDYGFLRYSSNNWQLSFGRHRITWGNYTTHALLLSSTGPNWDGAYVKFNFLNFSYHFFAGYLETVADNDENINRYIGGHLLTYHYKNWYLGAGETIIYSGANRAFDLSYIVPFVPFLESDANLRFNQRVQEQDNAFLFLGLEYRNHNNFRGFLHWLIDDIQIDPNDRKRIPDNTALSSGFQFQLLTLPFYDQISLSYERVGSWTYRYTRPFTNYQSRGLLLGTPNGSDFESWRLTNTMLFSKPVRVQLIATYVRRGEKDLKTDLFSLKDVTRKLPFPSGIVESTVQLQSWLTVFPRPGILIELGLAYNHSQNYNHVSGTSHTDLSVGLHTEFSLGLTWD
ncbi:MAG: hypothetical protein D6732_05785 [Methanobacteriota archaeon]|nr:MAG: hypothetical protein D6732_05785 [Euryarchaeota archaeon]